MRLIILIVHSLEYPAHRFVVDTMQSSKGHHAYVGLGKFLAPLSRLLIAVLACCAVAAGAVMDWWLMAATFGEHISGVVFGRAQKQVIGVRAWWIITLMQTVKTVGNWAVMQFVGKAVCGNQLPINAKLPITVLRRTADPAPTFLRAVLVYLFPKAIFDGTLFSKPNMMPWKKANGLTSHIAFVLAACDGNWGGLTASTHAQPVRIGTVLRDVFFALVTKYVMKWFTFDPPFCFVCPLRQWRQLSASAVAITVRSFVHAVIVPHLMRTQKYRHGSRGYFDFGFMVYATRIG